MAFVDETEENDLNEEEDTSSEDGHSEENEEEEDDAADDTSDAASDDESGEEGEETVESLKSKLAKEQERALKAERDRDNYKIGLLSRKAKERTLDLDEETETVTPTTEAAPVKKEKSGDELEQRVQTVLQKERERGVLRKVIDRDSEYFIGELVDDKQYKEIIQYMPRRYDKTSEQGIVRGLKAAVAAWKADVGYAEKTKKKSQPVYSEKTGGGGGAGSHRPAKTSTLKIPKSQVPMTDWYKKKS